MSSALLSPSSPFAALPPPDGPTATNLDRAASLVQKAIICLRGLPTDTDGSLFRDACAWAATNPLLGGSASGAVLDAATSAAWEREMQENLDTHPGSRARRQWCQGLMEVMWSTQSFSPVSPGILQGLSLLPDWRKTPWPLMATNTPVKNLASHLNSAGNPGRLLYFTEALSQWLVYRLPGLALKDAIYSCPRSTWVTEEGIRMQVPGALDETAFSPSEQKTLANDRSVLLALADSHLAECTEFWASVLYARVLARGSTPGSGFTEAAAHQGALLFPLLDKLPQRTWMMEDPGHLLFQAIPGFSGWQREQRAQWDRLDLEAVVADRPPQSENSRLVRKNFRL